MDSWNHVLHIRCQLFCRINTCLRSGSNLGMQHQFDVKRNNRREAHERVMIIMQGNIQ